MVLTSAGPGWSQNSIPGFPLKYGPQPPINEQPEEPPQRSFIAEWTVTIILLLFGTTSLVQAFVIPTASMEDTLLVGDHLLVDKLAYAPPGGSISSHILPYREPKRGDIIVFRYPVDISQTFVKRCIGVPGDRIRLIDKNLILNGKAVNEPYVYHKAEFFDPYRDEFPIAGVHIPSPASDMLRNHVVNGKWWCRPAFTSPWATTAIFPRTADIGDSCRAPTSLASLSLSTGRTTLLLTTSLILPSVLNIFWIYSNISRLRPAGRGLSV